MGRVSEKEVIMYGNVQSEVVAMHSDLTNARRVLWDGKSMVSRSVKLERQYVALQSQKKCL